MKKRLDRGSIIEMEGRTYGIVDFYVGKTQLIEIFIFNASDDLILLRKGKYFTVNLELAHLEKHSKSLVLFD